MNPSPKPFGKYFLLEKIAVGGMAEVYKAKTFGVDGFEKIVAIKKILSHWASDPEFIHMLIDEAKLSVLLTHPNIVEVLDLGSFEEDYFIAMGFVEGFDLKTLMNRISGEGKSIPTDITCFIAMQVAAGLDYAHKKTQDGNPLHIIHRDVSPHNILLSYEGEVKIIDFGIAKATYKKSFTTTGMLKGKFSYMSPEQVRGETLTPQSDIFSLGLVLYEMLTGKKCFDGDTELHILDKIRSCQLKIEDFPQAIPGSLKQILAKALAGNCSERYASADLMQIDLAKVLAELHPGFLQKDCADFLKPYRRVPASPPQTASSLAGSYPRESSVSSTSPTSISYIPGFKEATQASTLQKKTSRWVWVTPLLILLLGAVGVSSYFIWTQVVAPRLAAFNKTAEPKGGGGVAPVPLPSVAPVPPVPLPPVVSATSQPANNTAVPQADEFGQAYVSSMPAEAEIFVDDQATGLKTPATLGRLSLHQPHRIRLTKPGYLILEAVYTPTTSDLQRLDLPLRELPSAPRVTQTSSVKQPRIRNYSDEGRPARQGGRSQIPGQVAPPPAPSLIIGQ